jgi:hypothetical protein
VRRRKNMKDKRKEKRKKFIFLLKQLPYGILK